MRVPLLFNSSEEFENFKKCFNSLKVGDEIYSNGGDMHLVVETDPYIFEPDVFGLKKVVAIYKPPIPGFNVNSEGFWCPTGSESPVRQSLSYLATIRRFSKIIKKTQ